MESEVTVENINKDSLNKAKEKQAPQMSLDIDLYALHNSFPDIECNIGQNENNDTEVQIIKELNEIKQRADAINLTEERINFATQTINEIFPNENELADNSNDTENIDPLMETLIAISIKIF